MCESSRYSRQQRQMTAFSLSARLHLCANSDLALSLPQSRCFNLFSPRQLCPLAVLRSCFGYLLSHLRTAAACLSRCIRHRRRSKAKPLRGSRGGYRRKPQNCKRRVPQLSPLLAGCPHPSRRGAAPCHLPQRGRLRRLPPQSTHFPSASTLNHRKNGLSISVEHRLSSV